ncbi:alkaline phosphatase [Yaniella halotolerans]|uniref:alkaline phosphatase n=1 Tax=Yaniella halotolerans TaxID=225453 RepID=UPI0003B32790|nr:alkaline phosphatase [Yaniella halotolerans]
MSKISIQRAATGVLAAAVVAGAVVAPANADQNSAEAPKNVIVMIGDGMGYNHVVNTNLYETGQSQYITSGEAGDVTEHDGDAVQVYENFNHLGLTTTSLTSLAADREYDSTDAWGDFNWAKDSPTDSAAAGTAMATGTKVENGALNVDPEGNELKTMSELAHETGRSAGVVSSVQYSHATPASYAVANENRNNYLEIGDSMVNAEYLDVVMGAGHPEYDDSGQEKSASYDYIAEDTYNAVSNGETDWDYVESKSDFEALANGEIGTEKVFGLAQVETTLQQARGGDSEGKLPGEVPFNDNVPDLPTMSEGALEVLGQNEDGFHLMIEGGAIDWTGHANETTRNIEETQDFNASVESVVNWVEENSSWDETLLVVTADHETGYLGGAEDDPAFTEMTGEAGELPTVGWSSGNHTNHLVPYFFKGAGSDAILNSTVGEDDVRGGYIDNTTVANLFKDELWVEQDDGSEEPAEGDIPVEADVRGLGDNNDGENPDPGSLVLSVSEGSASLGNQRNAGDRLRMTGQMPSVAVTDTRNEANGWSVAGQSSDLTAGDETVSADHLGWVPNVVDEDENPIPGGAVAGTLTGGEGLATPQTLGQADADNRMGSTELAADLNLEVPVDTASGTYEGALSVSLFPVD